MPIKTLVKKSRPGMVQDKYNPKWRCCPLCEEYMPWQSLKYHQCEHVSSTIEDRDGEFKLRDFSICPTSALTFF